MPNNGNGNRHPISSALLRRLAEAADGYRNVGSVFFLARPKENPQSPTLFDISQGYLEEVIARAEEVATAPAQVPEAQMQAAIMALEPSDQVKFQKYLEDKEKAEREFDLYGPFQTNDGKKAGVVVTEIVLKVTDVETGAKREVTVPTIVDGKSAYDCMFWSLSAVQKFAVPYYTRVSGTAVADRMEASFVSDAFFCSMHKPVTEWVNITCPDVGDLAKLENPPQTPMGKGFKAKNGVVEEFDVPL